MLMRSGEQAQTVLKRVEAKTAELNRTVLPPDVKIRPYYDRSDLIALTTRTVEDNLLRGIVLVIVVLIFFLYNVRTGLIVAATIPLSLLFAFIILDLRNIPANLLSIGAIDFGILVDGGVVMVENIYRQLARRHGTTYSIREVIATAAAEVDRPIVYAVAVIVAGFLPIYVLSGPSGRLFTPMADTMIYALIGSLVLTLTLLPVLCMRVLRRGVRERRNPVFERVRSWYERGLDWSLVHRRIVIGGSVLLAGLALLLVTTVGAEFMPHLDEGALWVRATMPYTISLEESQKIVPQIRAILRSFPEVTVVGSEHGRPDDGTDATGFFNAEFFVGLKPYSEWKGPYHRKPELIEAVDKKLSAFPGITFNYTQPAEDNVNEVETGLKSSLDVKLFGPDLKVLQTKGLQIKHVLDGVRGITHVTLVQELGQPSLTVTADREKLARYGLNVEDVNGLIEAAVGGAAATQVVQGERLFDLVVRLSPQYRETPEAIGNILLPTPVGDQVPLRTVARLELSNGASFIYRQNNARFIGIQYSVEGRDLAGAVRDAQAQVARTVSLPQGYRTVWGGEFEEYTASRSQLQLVLPITLGLDLPAPVRPLSQLQVPVDHGGGSAAVGADRGHHRPRADRDALLGVVGDRFSGTVRRVGPDGRGLHLVRQRIAACGTGHPRRHARSSRSPAAAYHDDRPCRRVRPAPGRALDRRGVGLAEAVRDGHRGRPVLAPPHQRFSHARVVSCGSTGRRSSGGIAERG